jgi:integrase
MAVYDQWHKAPAPGDAPCSCGTRKNPLYPSSRHKTGKRWQVRWYEPDGKVKQPKKNFGLRVGRNPEVHADAFNALVERHIDVEGGFDPDAGNITFEAYAEDWRKTRGGLDDNEAAALEGRLRLHAYQDPDTPGRTRRGGVSIGQRKMRDLAKRPSLIQGWIQSMPLAEASARLVVMDVSAVFRSAVDDGAVPRDPVRVSSVDRPPAGRTKARPWPREHVVAMAAALDPRIAIVPYLGAGTGARQGEMLGLGADDIRFLGRDPRVSYVRQVKIVGRRVCFAPLKNGKEHRPPLSPSLAGRLAAHMAEFPPVAVTLPWYDPDDKERHGKPVTVRLVLTTADGGAWRRDAFNRRWRAAQEAAGIVTREPGEKRPAARQDGCHALRHTYASAQLRHKVDIVRVAAWMGDDPETVWKTYAHLMPDQDDDDGREAVDALLAPEPLAPDMPREADGGT